jgi:hypothetical protein
MGQLFGLDGRKVIRLFNIETGFAPSGWRQQARRHFRKCLAKLLEEHREENLRSYDNKAKWHERVGVINSFCDIINVIVKIKR